MRKPILDGLTIRLRREKLEVIFISLAPKVHTKMFVTMRAGVT